MSECYYVRGLELYRKRRSLNLKALSEDLELSADTVRKILSGRPVSLATARKIMKSKNPGFRTKKIVVERPDRVAIFVQNKKIARYISYADIREEDIVPPAVLKQILAGRPFTRTFEVRLRRMLRWLLVLPDELTIVDLDVGAKSMAAEEWRLYTPASVSEDDFFDLFVWARDAFRVYLETHDRQREKRKRLQRSGSFHVSELRLPKAGITSLGLEKKRLLVMLGLAHNELAVLSRLSMLSLHHARQGRMYDAFALSQQLTMLKLYAGKQYEAWRMFERVYYKAKLSIGMDKLLTDETRFTLRSLKKYFSASSNHIQRIRNEEAFHYGQKKPTDWVGSLDSETESIAYLSFGNYHLTHYHFSEIAILNNLLSDINSSRREALNILKIEVAETGLRLLGVIQEIVLTMIKEINGVRPKSMRAIVMEVEFERKKNGATLPIFVDGSDYRKDFLRFSHLI